MLNALSFPLALLRRSNTILYPKLYGCYAKARGKAGMGVLIVIKFDISDF